MDEVKISMREFLATVASPRGLVLENVEKTCRNDVRDGRDFSLFVGSDKMYTVSLDSMKEYFGIKDAPQKEVGAVDEKAAEKFMKLEPSDFEHPAPAAKDAKKDVRK